ncbi:MAG: DUF4249 domain-containing protein [Prevotellaceae bacterium]|jgi:hypothetical protein|nr:DUF4249 domain-containing protein [Prevotellaceae bacterium]
MRKIFFVALPFCLGLFSCTSPIYINTKGAEPRLVIFGTINEDYTRHCIRITKSTNYFSNEAPPPVTDAIVTISVDNEVFTLAQDDTVPGSYFTDSLSAAAGKTYTLDVQLDFDNDGVAEHYQASSLMPKGPRVDSIKLSPIVLDKVPILFLYGQVYYETENHFCIYTGKNNEEQGLFDYFMILSDAYISTIGNAYPMPYFAEGGIHKGDTVNFRVDNLNLEYANFLSEVSQETSVSTPIFSAPPAEVVTNIKCLNANIKVSGFFAAYSKGRDLITISNIDFKF